MILTSEWLLLRWHLLHDLLNWLLLTELLLWLSLHGYVSRRRLLSIHWHLLHLWCWLNNLSWLLGRRWSCCTFTFCQDSDTILTVVFVLQLLFDTHCVPLLSNLLRKSCDSLAEIRIFQFSSSFLHEDKEGRKCLLWLVLCLLVSRLSTSFSSSFSGFL